MERAADATAQLKSRAIRLLARREQSRAELKRKLAPAPLENDEDITVSPAVEQLDDLLDQLVDAGLQSDERFAQALLRQYVAKGKGPLLLQQALRQHQLPQSQIRLLLDSVDWQVQAIRVRQKRFGVQPPADQKHLGQMQRFLLSRGFTAEQCRSAVFLVPA